MVRDQQVGTPLDRLGDDGLHGIDGEEDARDIGVEVADHGADGVPVVGPARVVQLVEDGDDVTQRGHGTSLVGRLRRS